MAAGSLHCFFEGYFVLNHSRMPMMQDFFGQLWKEYAKSDSRYLAADSLVLTLETVTVVCCRPAHSLPAVFAPAYHGVASLYGARLPSSLRGSLCPIRRTGSLFKPLSRQVICSVIRCTT